MELHARKPVNKIRTYLPIIHLVAQQIGEIAFPLHLVYEDAAQKLAEYLAACVELLLAVVHVVEPVAHQDPHRIGYYLTETSVSVHRHVAVVGIVYHYEVPALLHICQHALKGHGTGAGGGQESQFLGKLVLLRQVSEVGESIEAHLYRWSVDVCLDHDFFSLLFSSSASRALASSSVSARHTSAFLIISSLVMSPPVSALIWAFMASVASYSPSPPAGLKR